jgi:hypothetical protein
MGVDPVALYAEFPGEGCRIDIATDAGLVVLAEEVDHSPGDLLDRVWSQFQQLVHGLPATLGRDRELLKGVQGGTPLDPPGEPG